MTHYLNLSAKRNVGVPPYVTLGYLVKMVHHFIFHNNQNLVLTFPNAVFGEGANPGYKARLHASEDVLNDFVLLLKSDKRFNEILEFGNVNILPSDINKYVSFYRVRVPSKNKGKKEHYEGQREVLLKRRLDVINLTKNLPYLKVESKSTNCFFNMNFNKMEIDISEISDNKNGILDGYGFSHKLNPIWVPDF